MRTQAEPLYSVMFTPNRKISTAATAIVSNAISEPEKFTLSSFLVGGGRLDHRLTDQSPGVIGPGVLADHDLRHRDRCR